MEKEEQKSRKKEKYKSIGDLDRGERLKSLIKKKGTQEGFFDEYGEQLGISFGSLKNYMAGSDIPLDVLKKLIDILDTTADYLLFGDEDRTAKKEENKGKDKIPLTNIYRSIYFFMDFFGENIVSFDDDDVKIKIKNCAIHDGIYQIKRLKEILHENADLKETLEEAIEKILKADGYVAERKSLFPDDEIYVYNGKFEFLKYVRASGHPEGGDFEPEHYEIMPIWESDDFTGDIF